MSIVRCLPLLVLWAVPLGCAHRVQVLADPVGARVSLDGTAQGPAPTEFTARWKPFSPMTVTVSLTGYRSATLDLQRDLGPLRLFGEFLRPWTWNRWWGAEVRSVHKVYLVRQHGRAGTWSPEDARR